MYTGSFSSLSCHMSQPSLCCVRPSLTRSRYTRYRPNRSSLLFLRFIFRLSAPFVVALALALPRVVVTQPELVTCIEKHLRPGGTLFMQSDVLDVVEDMRIITRETARESFLFCVVLLNVFCGGSCCCVTAEVGVTLCVSFCFVFWHTRTFGTYNTWRPPCESGMLTARRTEGGIGFAVFNDSGNSNAHALAGANGTYVAPSSVVRRSSLEDLRLERLTTHVAV